MTVPQMCLVEVQTHRGWEKVAPGLERILPAAKSYTKHAQRYSLFTYTKTGRLFAIWRTTDVLT